MSKKQLSPEAQAIISACDAELHATTVTLVEKFLIDNPDSQRAWLDLGQALGQLARYDESEQAFLKVIELGDDASSAAIFGEIGNLYRAKGDFQTAKQWYQKQIDADSSDATGWLYLGNLLMRQGEFEAAETALGSALECDSVCLEEVHLALGLVKRSLGQFTEARTHLETAIQMDPNLAAAKIALKDVKFSGH